jgi:hypothetical protein
VFEHPPDLVLTEPGCMDEERFWRFVLFGALHVVWFGTICRGAALMP